MSSNINLEKAKQKTALKIRVKHLTYDKKIARTEMTFEDMKLAP
ncbi:MULTISPECIES: hypothetical protein [Peribacillus]|nr:MULTISPECIES: hypothetical protein [unclassified Peribacillus]